MTRIRRAAAALAAADVLVALAACTPIDPFRGAPERTDEPTSAAEQEAIWRVPADACDDDAVRAAVEDAVVSGAEGPGSSLLATPDEVPRDARERQARAWRDLDAEALAFQLCLRALQTGDGAEPLSSTDEAATDLDPESILEGFDARLEPGETRTFEVDIDLATVPCTDGEDATAFAPLLVVAVDGEPLPHPVLGAAWRP